jgi:hypothetical protein
MANLWLKFKVWSKISLFAAALIYVLTFIAENASIDVHIWVWFGKRIDSTLLKLAPCLLLTGVVGTLLVRMAFSTVRQIREMRQRGRQEQLHKDVADMRSKAEKLQTKPENPVK